MAVETGMRRIDTIATSQRAIDLHKEILLLEPEAAPITVVLKQINQGGRRRAAIDTKIRWHNDELEDRLDAANGAQTSTSTSIVVDTGALFAADDLVYIPRTTEVVLVTAVTTNTLTVVRGVGASTAAAINDNDVLYVIGTADEEGDTSPAARAEDPVEVVNFTQIFKHTVHQSGSLLSSSNLSSPHDWDHWRRKTGIEHLKDIELAFILGSPAENESPGSGKGNRRTTGGLLHFLDQNVQDEAGTALTEAEFETWLRKLFRFGSQNRTLFASRLVVSVLNEFAQSKLQTTVGAETFGVKVFTWISPHGELKIVSHPLLEGGAGDTGQGLDTYAIGVDFQRSEIAYRFLNGEGPGGSRDTHLIPNVQTPDEDARKDLWLTECGLQVGLPKLHGVLKGVTG